MKRYIYIVLLSIAVMFTHTSCDGFFDTQNNEGVDVDGGLSTKANVENALNGTYYNLYYYAFGGNYAVSIGDIAADLTYFGFSNGHWNSIYSYNVTEEDTYLQAIWQYGYKVADNATRIIEAYSAIYDSQTPSDKAELDVMVGEAYALRATAYLYMSNCFCLPYKVEGGANNGDQLGLVILDKPIGVNDKVSRSTIAQTYEAIISDLNSALTYFDKGGSNRGVNYMSPVAVHALKARTYLYMEDYNTALTEANTALTLQNGSIITDATKYAEMFTSLATGGGETIYAISVDASNNLSANSPGTLWTTYTHMISNQYAKYLGANDIRQVLMERGGTPIVSLGGKYRGYNGNPAVSSQRLIGIPEMYLIAAEASLKKSSADIAGAQKALLEVAKRNPDIKTVSDLPSTKDALVKFVEDERVRELIQEGHRFQDCRRWGKKISAYLTSESTGVYRYNDFDVSKFCYPIPYTEISSGAGVVQNPNWSAALPK
ncbi:MAG: RagB/SusD family nutrient uptake outer membrane protein [Prevotella sp.]|jgi:hypothetical protein|nr:RagB/SusD family nutrient uptake outer membrane protein [Prevotella sp.]